MYGTLFNMVETTNLLLKQPNICHCHTPADYVLKAKFPFDTTLCDAPGYIKCPSCFPADVQARTQPRHSLASGYSVTQ